VNVLFDLDGTLTDPRQGILACFQYALEALQFDCPPIASSKDSSVRRCVKVLRASLVPTTRQW